MALPQMHGLTPNPNGTGWTRYPITSKRINGVQRQVFSYYSTTLNPVIAVRDLPDGEWRHYHYNGTTNTPDLDIRSDWDGDHFNICIGIDKDGILHFVYSTRRETPRYYRSDSSVDSWTGTLTGPITMYSGLSGTYPSFQTDPTGKLYFGLRNGDNDDGDWTWLQYDESAETWSGMFGVTDGLILDGKTGTTPTYGVYCILPSFSSDWDGAGTGYCWFAFHWRKSGYADDSDGDRDPCAIYTDGTTWYKHTGAAQTIPATFANTTAVVSINETGGETPFIGRGVALPDKEFSFAWTTASVSTGSTVSWRMTKIATAGTAETYSTDAGNFGALFYDEVKGKVVAVMNYYNSNTGTTAYFTRDELSGPLSLDAEVAVFEKANGGGLNMIDFQSNNSTGVMYWRNFIASRGVHQAADIHRHPALIGKNPTVRKAGTNQTWTIDGGPFGSFKGMASYT